MRKFLGRFLCLLGIHDYRVVDATMGFGSGGSVARMECRRCGAIATRRI